jgi:hypothetical protein
LKAQKKDVRESAENISGAVQWIGLEILRAMTGCTGTVWFPSTYFGGDRQIRPRLGKNRFPDLS